MGIWNEEKNPQLAKQHNHTVCNQRKLLNVQIKGM